MGLDDLVDEKTPDSSSSSSSTTSGSSTEEILPEVTFIRDTDTGDLEVRRYPESVWEDQTFKHEKVELIIKSKEELTRIKNKLKEHDVTNYVSIIKDDPERALELAHHAKQTYFSQVIDHNQRCPICNEKVDLYTDKYERIGRKVIHRNHTIGDLADAGMINDLETEWDFVEKHHKS